MFPLFVFTPRYFLITVLNRVHFKFSVLERLMVEYSLFVYVRVSILIYSFLRLFDRIMFLYFIFSLYFSNCFAITYIEHATTSIDDDYVRNIISALNSDYEFSHIGIICENQTNFCIRICAQLQRISIPSSISIIKQNNSSVTSLGKLNILYFHSEILLLNFIQNNYSNWNPNLYYVIFLQNSNVTKILDTLWNKFKIRRAILFDEIGSYYGSIYDIISNTSKKINSKNSLTKDLFTLNNFQTTPLRISLFKRIPEVLKIDGKLTGGYYRLVELLSQKLNFTPVIQRSKDRMKFGSYVNGKYTGGLGDIVYGKSDIACNGYFIQKTYTKEYTYLFPLSMDYICLMVPKAGKIPKYMAPFKCFPEEVWFTMMVTFASVALVRYFIYYVHRSYFKRKENSSILLTTFSASINMPVSFSQYKYLSSRIILIIFLSQMYVIVTSFQGSLVMLLSVPKFYKDIDTLAELNRTDMKIKVGSSSLMSVFEHDSALKTMAKRVNRVNDDDFRNFNFAFFARFIHHKQKLFRTYSIQKHNRSVKVHRIRECPLMYYTTFIVAWNFPFVEEFNSVMARVVETGLMIKWDREVLYKIVKDLQPEIQLKRGDEQMENKIFTLNDLEVAFFVLIAGYCCSFCIFIREIIKSKRN